MEIYYHQIQIWQVITKLVSIKLFGSPLLSSFAQISLLSYFVHLEFSYRYQAGSFFINIVWGTIRNCKQRRSVWSTCVEWKKQALPHWWDSWHCIACNTDSPIHIHKFIPHELWKAFNVGINAWNIIAVLYSNGDRTTWLSPFPWRSP